MMRMLPVPTRRRFLATRRRFLATAGAVLPDTALSACPPARTSSGGCASPTWRNRTIEGEPITGRFRTAPAGRRTVRFVWSGDTAGQGWGIDVERGGMRTFATILGHRPDFFIHSGDTVYCDGPIEAEKAMPDGGTWKNITMEGVHKVAETLEEFRANWKYNMLDEHVRALNAEVPIYFQGDDHEVTNNWYPGESLADDEPYTVKSADLLAARANRAFHEMTPIRPETART